MGFSAAHGRVSFLVLWVWSFFGFEGFFLIFNFFRHFSTPGLERRVGIQQVSIMSRNGGTKGGRVEGREIRGGRKGWGGEGRRTKERGTPVSD